MTHRETDLPIRGDKLFDAFQDLRFGNAFKDVMIEVLESRGVELDANHRYSYSQIEKALSELLDKSTAHLITNRLARVMVI